MGEVIVDRGRCHRGRGAVTAEVAFSARWSRQAATSRGVTARCAVTVPVSRPVPGTCARSPADLSWRTVWAVHLQAGHAWSNRHRERVRCITARIGRGLSAGGWFPGEWLTMASRGVSGRWRIPLSGCAARWPDGEPIGFAPATGEASGDHFPAQVAVCSRGCRPGGVSSAGRASWPCWRRLRRRPAVASPRWCWSRARGASASRALLARFASGLAGATVLRASGDEAELLLPYGIVGQLVASARGAGAARRGCWPRS